MDFLIWIIWLIKIWIEKKMWNNVVFGNWVIIFIFIYKFICVYVYVCINLLFWIKWACKLYEMMDSCVLFGFKLLWNYCLYWLKMFI